MVCLTKDVPSNVIERDDGWKAFYIQGTLDFSLIGILSKISGILAENGIGIFAISTFNTDYVLTKNENYERASKVQFAHNDAVIFGKYCNQTLGIPMKNLRRYKDATFGSMLAAMKDIKDISEAFMEILMLFFIMQVMAFLVKVTKRHICCL